MRNDPIALAQKMLAVGRQAEAIALVATAAAHGDPAAYYQQALWHLVGTPLPRDLPRARERLALASARGHAEARLVEVALVANGSGALPNWQQAITLLKLACVEGDHVGLDLLELLSNMELTDAGEPRTPVITKPIVNDGSVRLAPKLLSVAECAHLVRSSADLLAPAAIVDPRTGRTVAHPIRTSDAAVISPVREDPVIRAINVRIASASATHVQQGEALTILRYKAGQQFRMHSDLLPNVSNQRVATVLIYLNDGFGGGQTIFPHHGLSITPKAGDAVIFDNVTADRKQIVASNHAGAPVTSGVKWLATRWIRERPFDVWRGPEAN